jgi:hypothetical protein
MNNKLCSVCHKEMELLDETMEESAIIPPVVKIRRLWKCEGCNRQVRTVIETKPKKEPEPSKPSLPASQVYAEAHYAVSPIRDLRQYQLEALRYAEKILALLQDLPASPPAIEAGKVLNRTHGAIQEIAVDLSNLISTLTGKPD